MNSMKVTLSAYRDAHKFIWKEGIIKLIKVPLLLTLAYFPFMFLTAYFLAEFFIGFLLDMLGAFVPEDTCLIIQRLRKKVALEFSASG